MKIYLESLQVNKKLTAKKRKEVAKFHKVNETNLSGLTVFQKNFIRNRMTNNNILVEIFKFNLIKNIIAQFFTKIN